MKSEIDKGALTHHPISSLHKKVTPPMNLRLKSQQKKAEALESFKKRALGDFIKEYGDLLEELIKEKYNHIKKIYSHKIEV